MKPTLILAALAATTCLGTAAAAQTFRLACPSAATSSTCMTADRFAEEARALSAGAIDVQVFPAGQLGSGESAIQQMRAGVLDFVVEDLSNFGNFVPDYNVVSWGFTFRDADHFQSFLDSDLNQAMIDQLRDDQGIEMIAADWRKLPRVVVSTVPIETPEDLAGLNFRVPAIPSYIATWQTLGTNPTQVPWSDSFQALKTGIVDAMESPFDSVPSQKFHLAAPYVTMTNHVYSSITLTMNEARFAALSPEDQQILRDAAATAADYSADLAETAAADIATLMESEGATIIEIDRDAFASRLADAVAQQEADGLWSAGLYDRIQALD